uniref:Uncharacterized protein n=1 Tax=Anguilla anguilla TaxID=7936 RepID=A0A0E9XVZ8_ANGAN
MCPAQELGRYIRFFISMDVLIHNGVTYLPNKVTFFIPWTVAE